MTPIVATHVDTRPGAKVTTAPLAGDQGLYPPAHRSAIVQTYKVEAHGDVEEDA